jgi:hypothetical protein
MFESPVLAAARDWLVLFIAIDFATTVALGAATIGAVARAAARQRS